MPLREAADSNFRNELCERFLHMKRHEGLKHLRSALGLFIPTAFVLNSSIGVEQVIIWLRLELLEEGKEGVTASAKPSIESLKGTRRQEIKSSKPTNRRMPRADLSLSWKEL